MTISLKNIQSLTEFKRNANVYVEQVRTDRSPLVLTINGKAAVVVQDADSFQATVDRLQAAETELQSLKLAQLRQDLQVGLDQLSQGQSLDYTADTVHELFDEIKRQGRAEMGGDR
jgi:prevent-host-death family protein